MPPKLSVKEKAEAEIKRLSRLEGNRTCVDCNEKMPTYIDMTHKTFVCQKCSGIHRELQYKIKGMSMTVFNLEDAAEIAKGGNVPFNFKYMARYTGKEASYPSNTDSAKLKEFIHNKYLSKKWFSEDGSANDPRDFQESFGGTATSSTLSRNRSHQLQHQTSSQSITNSGTSNGNNNSGSGKAGDRLSVGNNRPLAASVDLLNFDGGSSNHNNGNSSNGFSSGSSNVASAPQLSSFDPFGSSTTNTQQPQQQSFAVAPPVNYGPFAPTSPPVSSNSNNQNFNATSTSNHNQSNSNGNGSFDPFAPSQTNHQPPQQQSFQPQSQQSFDPFGASTAPVQQQQSQQQQSFHDPFAPQPQVQQPSQQQYQNQQQQFQPQQGQQQYQPQQGQQQQFAPTSNTAVGNNSFMPSAPAPVAAAAAPTKQLLNLPFISLTPPVSATPPAVAEPVVTAPAVVKLPGFNAFNEIAPPVTANPFDMQAQQQQHAQYPQQYPPKQQQQGYPQPPYMQGGMMMPPQPMAGPGGGYYSNNMSYPPQQPNNPYAPPGVQMTGIIPPQMQQQYGGYPSQQQLGYPSGPYPPQQQQLQPGANNPFFDPAVAGVPVTVNVPAPVAAPVSDSFSSFTGIAFESAAKPVMNSYGQQSSVATSMYSPTKPSATSAGVYDVYGGGSSNKVGSDKNNNPFASAPLSPVQPHQQYSPQPQQQSYDPYQQQQVQPQHQLQQPSAYLQQPSYQQPPPQQQAYPPQQQQYQQQPQQQPDMYNMQNINNALPVPTVAPVVAAPPASVNPFDLF